MRVSAIRAELDPTLELGSTISSRTSPFPSGRFDSEATTAALESSNSKFFAFVQEQEVAALNLTAALEISTVDRDRIRELLRSLGYKSVDLGLREGLGASLQQGGGDLLVASLDGDGPRLYDDAQVSPCVSDTEIPLLVIVRETKVRKDAASECAADPAFPLAPCNSLEIEARLMGLRNFVSLRESGGEFRCGSYYFNPIGRTVHFRGNKVRLQPMEFELACRFFLFPWRPHSREALLRSVWGQIRLDSRTRALDNHVSRLRKKLDLGPHCGYELVAVYSVGYRLEVPFSMGGENFR